MHDTVALDESDLHSGAMVHTCVTMFKVVNVEYKLDVRAAIHPLVALRACNVRVDRNFYMLILRVSMAHTNSRSISGMDRQTKLVKSLFYRASGAPEVLTTSATPKLRFNRKLAEILWRNGAKHLGNTN